MDATVEGNWFAWLAASSSPTIGQGLLESDDPDSPGLIDSATVFECSGRGWNAETNDWDEGYIGPRDGESSDSRFIGGDCNPDDAGCDSAALAAACEPVDEIEFHTWLQTDGYYAITSEIEAWRTEAYINGEGDFQLTVHQDLGNKEDFRFVFSVDPDFAPVTCETGEGGQAQIEYVDGSNWTEQWSSDEDTHNIYYLNAGGYQVNPSDTDDYWYLPSDWNSGYGHAKFSSEEFNSHPVDFGNYENDISDHFLLTDRDSDTTQASYDSLIANMDESTSNWANEMVSVAGAWASDAAAFEYKLEDNTWRDVDISYSGFDGWIEMHSSWVRIEKSATFEVGSSLSGDFQILFDGFESSSRIVVRGTFTIDELREDPWAYPILEDEERAEHGSEYCGGVAMP